MRNEKSGDVINKRPVIKTGVIDLDNFSKLHIRKCSGDDEVEIRFAPTLEEYWNMEANDIDELVDILLDIRDVLEYNEGRD